ncbi:hydroxyisourate hydrolase [Enterobacteriaceae bacterium 4M9]|nr:hydroxyisourate hydrolase [Enterobacteriaceae bacterium 4M9]
MSSVTTHILDTALGQPAQGIVLRLERDASGDWEMLATGVTDDDGRCRELTTQPLQAGRYRLTADIGAYFTRSGRDTLYPSAQIDFVMTENGGHYHLPFLISPWSWSTYRGS